MEKFVDGGRTGLPFALGDVEVLAACYVKGGWSSRNAFDGRNWAASTIFRVERFPKFHRTRIK